MLVAIYCGKASTWTTVMIASVQASDGRILLQSHCVTGNVAETQIQPVTVTSLALQGTYTLHTGSAVSRRILGRFSVCLALWAQHDHSYQHSQAPQPATRPKHYSTIICAYTSFT